jgi:hypothetical protein
VTRRRSDDPAQADRAWAGYHPRAALPALAAAAAVSLLVWAGRWYFAELSELAARLGALAAFALAWGVWPALGAAYVYRMVTYTYRVTDRAVLVDFGFWHRPVPPTWLAEVREVRVGVGWLSRRLGVGWVEVRTADRVVRLTGVRHPEEFAREILAARDGRPKAQEPPGGDPAQAVG